VYFVNFSLLWKNVNIVDTVLMGLIIALVTKILKTLTGNAGVSSNNHQALLYQNHPTNWQT
jgi:hypothetical protein